MTEFLKLIYYWFCTGLVAILSFIFYPCRTSGRENIPRQGGFILASNHESNIDPMLLPVVTPRRLRFLAKDSLFKNPFWGFIIRTGGGIPVKRASADKGALAAVLHELEEGFPVLMFPQGTRGGAKVQPGVGFLAVKSGKPVVPVYIEGTARVLPKKVYFPKRHPVKVVFGKPVTFSSKQPPQEVAQKIMAAVFALKEKSA
ncbi:MAG: 1-acyl-sn-glycerol-3-phosphate acyltransferase [Candidatus Omnitrophica bacterium]|nr:1-acyl-sn-glycerol-3-phosphate acyltransferase [Candidatus Omnitrophota bacterium]